MAKKQSVSSFACSSPYIVRVFGLPVICACGKCKWCLDRTRKGSRELVNLVLRMPLKNKN